MEDYQIVALFWQRDESALRAVSDKYSGYCRKIAHNILSDPQDAEECVNDTWLAAWNSIPPHRPLVLSAYLAKLTRRIAGHRWQSRHADKRGGGEYALALEELSECLCSDSTVESAMDDAALAELIGRFVSALPDTERRVFISRYFAAESIGSIAARFGFRSSKVKSMLMRTRNKLRETLKEEGFQ
ncbi:MAG: RNA polymerase sigma factor [Ruminococcaceae bacterium]|nr:RNA polymerase sigma factor [Oscillospiraceae bacterium]